MFNKHPQTSTFDLYKTLELRPIEQILKIEQCKLIFKILHSKQKSNTVLTTADQIHQYYTRGNQHIFTEFSRTNFAIFNPIRNASKTFNSLPENLKNINNVNKFVINLKKYFEQ